ncbi:hypothetical protein AGMMS49992_25690 [Clostridia bacterium]|nr:hypothetical protein AGMMS49992_25690 [Clostridia bacterium]
MEPTAISVEPLADYCLRVVFKNGETRCFDVKPYFSLEWYQELVDIELFNTIHVAEYTLEWKNGQDLAPDCLYANSIPCT